MGRGIKRALEKVSFQGSLSWDVGPGLVLGKNSRPRQAVTVELVGKTNLKFEGAENCENFGGKKSQFGPDFVHSTGKNKETQPQRYLCRRGWGAKAGGGGYWQHSPRAHFFPAVKPSSPNALCLVAPLPDMGA